MWPRAYAIPPQTSTEFFSKSSITPARIFVFLATCSTVKPASSRAARSFEISVKALPFL